MEQGYCFLVESVSGATVAVNPSQVLFLRALSETRCEIVFDDDLKLEIEGSIKAVADKLLRAMS